MTVNRELLKQALTQAQEISKRAETGQDFDPRGGWGVLGAQLATAGIGAYAQNKAKRQLAEVEKQSQDAFAAQFPQFAGLASQLTPETRQAVIQKQLMQQFEKPIPYSTAGKVAADIKSGLLPEGTSFEDPKELQDAKDKVFKQTSDLRQEFTKNSGEFIKQKDAFDRINASIEESALPNSPRGAGDLALIFNYMKLLDPSSTVRESEFETAGNAKALLDKGVPTWIVKQYEQIQKGAFLTDAQRNDFFERSNKLYNKALTSQERRINQFKGIAERNKLPVEDVIIDLIGSDPKKAEVVKTVEQQKGAQTLGAPDREAAIAEAKRRGLI